MRHPITRNSVIDRVRLADPPPAFENSEASEVSEASVRAPHEESLNAPGRHVESGSSGASEIPE